jgi:hypothetical protein
MSVEMYCARSGATAGDATHCCGLYGWIGVMAGV